MTGASSHSYVIALGSNMRVPRIGGPRAVLRAALDTLDAEGVVLRDISRIRSSLPVGPSQRRYANGAALVASRHAPGEMLALLQAVEDAFGRRRRGAEWRARTLDLDIVLWSGGVRNTPDLTIPHPHFRGRDFVLVPAAEVAPRWRDPVTGLTLRQLAARGA